MLFEKIQKIQEKPIVNKLNLFFDSDVFPLVYGGLTLICSFIGIELAFFILTTIIVAFTTLFSKDTKSLITPLALTVYSISQKHTPQHPYSSNYLYKPYVLIMIGILIGIIAFCLIFRLVVYKSEYSLTKSKPIAFRGILVFCVALILNGVFYKEYTFYNLILGLALAVSFLFFYVYFFKTLKWNKDTGVYIAKVLTIACMVILIQLIETLIFDDVIKNGTIDKHILNLGWGMSNNVGGMLAMFMPTTFYLSYKLENKLCSRLSYAFGFIIMLGIVLTLSRTSLFIGGAAIVAIMILMSVKGKDIKFVRIFNIVVIAVCVVFAIVFAQKLLNIFQHYIDKGFDDSDRLFIWKNGLINFTKSPLFGVGFYTPIASDWSYNIENWFFPDMYHNTFIQLLASCGIVGGIAYIFHLIQGGFLFFKKLTVERLFYFFVILCLTLMSLFDNHIFHVFPALIYSVLFSVAEKDYTNSGDIKNINPDKRKNIK